MADKDVEAKIVILGSQGVGKTTLLHRYVHGTYLQPENVVSTIGASFHTKTFVSPDDPDAQIRLQLWDTAGQERFRSMTRLYYRGADVAILCYDITNQQSFEDVAMWLKELREGRSDEEDCCIHVVGTKADAIEVDPSKRAVSLDQCIAYVAENLQQLSVESITRSKQDQSASTSKRSSGAWSQFEEWNCCHEVSAKDGDGVEELFQAIVRDLIDRRMAKGRQLTVRSSGADSNNGGPSDGHMDGRGSFKVGVGSDKRKSWLSFASRSETPELTHSMSHIGGHGTTEKGGKCC